MAEQLPTPPSGGWGGLVYLVVAGIVSGSLEALRRAIADRNEQRNRRRHRRWDDDDEEW